ncbi:MAG: cyclic pyranopterin monophosphate synthase MoaC [Methanomassiliicoccales archaeon]|nr:MAG: cyclic pyranopterin monophosphate synthase MoaC [Methanomassiliicoccales archaeon]
MTKMVDIGEKNVSKRTAKARGEIKLNPDTIVAIKDGNIKKGDALNTAKTAAILAVKNTPNTIPLCHPIPIDSVEVKFDMNEESISCECEVSAHYKTGVEMESLVGVSVALLTIWDMVKYLEKDANGQYPGTFIEKIMVVLKQKE